MDVEEENVGAFFTKYVQVEEVASVTCKASIVTGDILLQVTMSRKYYLEIPDTLTCGSRTILVIVKSRQPHYRSYGATGHL